MMKIRLRVKGFVSNVGNIVRNLAHPKRLYDTELQLNRLTAQYNVTKLNEDNMRKTVSMLEIHATAYKQLLTAMVFQYKPNGVATLTKRFLELGRTTQQIEVKDTSLGVVRVRIVKTKGLTEAPFSPTMREYVSVMALMKTDN